MRSGPHPAGQHLRSHVTILKEIDGCFRRPAGRRCALLARARNMLDVWPDGISGRVKSIISGVLQLVKQIHFGYRT
jgi:hypothetical protein